MESMLTPGALARSIDIYCNAESSEDDCIESLNIIILQVHRGIIGGLDKLVSEHLREYLTNEQGFVRMRSTKLLSQLLKRIPNMKLEPHIMTAVVKFLCDRFKSDYESTGPCLEALKTILELHEDDIDIDSTANIQNTILTSHHVPSASQSIRHCIYQNTQIILESPKLFNAIRSKIESEKFIDLICDAIEGEKDPRCLLLTLRVASLIFREEKEFEFTFTSIESEELAVERVFDVACVYFPIVFRPPPNDPYNITSDDLWNVLNGVFYSHPLMAQHVISLLIDKLNLSSGDVTTAKIDSLKTLQVCLPKYGNIMISQYLIIFRNLFIKLVLHAEDSIIQEETSKTVGVIAAMQSQEEEVFQSFNEENGDSKQLYSNKWQEFVGEIVNQSVDSISKSIDSMTGWASGRLLYSIAKSSAVGLEFVLTKTLAVVKKWCVRPDASETQRAAAFELLCKLIEAVDPDIDFSQKFQPLKSEYVASIYDILQNELEKLTSSQNILMNAKDSESDTIMQESSLTVSNRHRSSSMAQLESGAQKSAIVAMKLLITRPPSLLVSINQIEKTVECLTSCLIDDNINEAVHQACVTALIEIGKNNMACAEAISSATVPLISKDFNTKRLGILTELCAIPSVFNTIMPRIFEDITKAYGQNIDFKVFHAIANILSSNQSYTEGLVNCCLPVGDSGILFPGLLKLVIENKIDIGVDGNQILRTLTQNVPVDVQKELLQFVLKMTKLEEESTIEINEKTMGSITAVIGSIQPSVQHDILKLQPSLANLINLVHENSDNELLCLHASQCMSSIINKANFEDISFNQEINSISKILLDGCTSLNDFKLRKINLQVLTWFAKGLGMRNHPLCNSISDKVINMLQDDNHNFALIAATYFGMVIRPYVQVLNKSCFAKESLLFRQKFFGHNFQILRKQFNENSTDVKKKTVLLLAIVKLVEFIPKSVLMSENCVNILQLLKQATACSNLDAQSSALVSLSTIIENRIELIEPQLSSLIPMLLELTMFKSKMSPKYRAIALDCLYAFSSLPYNKIHVMRQKVVRQLIPALDDPKRAIRFRAVRCRNAWAVLTNV